MAQGGNGGLGSRKGVSYTGKISKLQLHKNIGMGIISASKTCIQICDYLCLSLIFQTFYLHILHIKTSLYGTNFCKSFVWLSHNLNLKMLHNNPQKPEQGLNYSKYACYHLMNLARILSVGLPKIAFFVCANSELPD